MSTLRTFISALKTGETRTTKALEEVAARRRGAAAEGVIAALRHRAALNAPLQLPLREAIKDRTRLPERFIERCIDAWPDDQKERARRAMVRAINDGRRVRFRWGLTSGRRYETQIVNDERRVTITALSPKSTLRISDGEIYVAPGGPPRRAPG
jgi:hypothetical protein